MSDSPVTLQHGLGPWPRQVLMLVTDRAQCGDRPLPEVVAEAIEGGVNAVQQ